MGGIFHGRAGGCNAKLRGGGGFCGGGEREGDTATARPDGDGREQNKRKEGGSKEGLDKEGGEGG